MSATAIFSSYCGAARARQPLGTYMARIFEASLQC
jgi:hypothetical protein